MTPTTEAGRALLDGSTFHAWDCFGGKPCWCGLSDHISAIEAEAKAECEARNERLQQTLALHLSPDSVTMTSDYYHEVLAETEAEAYARALADAESAVEAEYDSWHFEGEEPGEETLLSRLSILAAIRALRP